MTIDKIKPSPAQLEALQRAAVEGFGSKPPGRLSHGCSITTINIMIGNGWIERAWYIRDTKERDALKAREWKLIQDSGCTLGANLLMWRAVLKDLSKAEEIASLLDREAYWLTDAGKALVEVQL